jgi:hypothetical protein
MRSTLFIFVLLLITAFARAQQATTYKGKQFSYTIYYDTSKCAQTYDTRVDSVVIVDLVTHKRKQSFNLDSSVGIPCDGDFVKANQFQIVDANFDGYEDILLMQFLPAAPNIPYYWWIYNPKTRLFAEDTALENITSPEFDSVNHYIYSTWRGSCCDHGNDTYEYRNGKAVLIEQSEDVYDPESKTDTLFQRKLVNGKMKEISKKVEKSDDGN